MTNSSDTTADTASLLWTTEVTFINTEVTSNVTDYDVTLKPRANANGDNVRTVDIVNAILYSIMGSAGVIGNLLVIIIIYKYTNLKKKLTNIFIIHQSMVDLLSSLVLLASAHTTGSHYVLYGGLGRLFCKLWLSWWIVFTMYTVSTYNLIALTFERYFAIVHPVVHRNAFTRRRAYAMMAVVWLLGPIINQQAATFTDVVDGKCFVLKFWPDKATQSAIGILNIFAKFFVPLCIFAFCYTHMILVLQKRVAPVQNPSIAVVGPQISAVSSNMTKAKHNVIKTLIVVSVGFVVCWVSNQMYFFKFCLGYQIDWSGAFYHFTVIMLNANCCINPVIYVFKFQEFKTGLKKFLHMNTQESNLFGATSSGSAVGTAASTLTRPGA